MCALAGLRLEVKISERPARSVISSYRSSAWVAVSSLIPKSSIYLALIFELPCFRW